MDTTTPAPPGQRAEDQMTRLYFIAPVDAPRDQFAAGYDGNLFATEEQAGDALVALADAHDTDETEWLVTDVPSEEQQGHPEYARVMASLRTWNLSEAGYGYGQCEADTLEAALTIAEGNVDRGNYDVEGTLWIDVRAVNPVTGEEGQREVVLAPDAPACAKGHEHDWQSPYEVLGGLKENPGVRGNGGGVIIREVCAHCGAYRVINTWAQRPDNGVQGYTTTEYEPADDESLAWGQEHGARAVLAAMDAAGYSGTLRDGYIMIEIEDAGEGSGDPALDEIRAAVAPLGWRADWTGEGNTDADGVTTSDIRVEPEA